ncbi:Uncharacterised protein [Bacillus tequilensis]|nr:Uncharacterised protein [Bacillus tequilensis]
MNMFVNSLDSLLTGGFIFYAEIIIGGDNLC